MCPSLVNSSVQFKEVVMVSVTLYCKMIFDWSNNKTIWNGWRAVVCAQLEYDCDVKLLQLFWLFCFLWMVVG